MPSEPRPRHELDLLSLLQKLRYEVALNRAETPAERAARIERSKDESDHRRRKDMLVTRAGVAVIAVASVASIAVAILPIGTAEDKSRGWTFQTMIAGGFIGFLTGRQFPADPTANGRG